MDLKNIKAMRVPLTKRPSKSRAPASSTDEPFRGSKNICRGTWAEDQALLYYQKKGYSCLQRRWRSPFAEIDLVLSSPGRELVLVEVKFVQSYEYMHIRLSRPQKERLKRALLFCLEQREHCQLELAVVSHRGEVKVFSDIFC
ncbi:MAG: hypothetical protein COT73_03640 [Bdellovibrio sp. CG10_big_fil_rev_8_21_14_0_10_47_8]|nr:MAG: hypothetical protein COT73_03640 [Bdellovibrio sp. CG10_big_fil_rev_8_21_14_0_10_47_8]